MRIAQNVLDEININRGGTYAHVYTDNGTLLQYSCGQSVHSENTSLLVNTQSIINDGYFVAVNNFAVITALQDDEALTNEALSDFIPFSAAISFDRYVNFIGFWFVDSDESEDTDLSRGWYIDFVLHCDDREDALQIARTHDEKYIWDIKNNREIAVK